MNNPEWMSITTKFGAKVRTARSELRISQEELALRSDLHRTYIGSVERGERNITLLNAEKIAQALDKQLSELLIDDE